MIDLDFESELHKKSWCFHGYGRNRVCTWGICSIPVAGSSSWQVTTQWTDWLRVSRIFNGKEKRHVQVPWVPGYLVIANNLWIDVNCIAIGMWWSKIQDNSSTNFIPFHPISMVWCLMTSLQIKFSTWRIRPHHPTSSHIPQPVWPVASGSPSTSWFWWTADQIYGYLMLSPIWRRMDPPVMRYFMVVHPHPDHFRLLWAKPSRCWPRITFTARSRHCQTVMVRDRRVRTPKELPDIKSFLTFPDPDEKMETLPPHLCSEILTSRISQTWKGGWQESSCPGGKEERPKGLWCESRESQGKPHDNVRSLKSWRFRAWRDTGSWLTGATSLCNLQAHVLPKRPRFLRSGSAKCHANLVCPTAAMTTSLSLRNVSLANCSASPSCRTAAMTTSLSLRSVSEANFSA